MKTLFVVLFSCGICAAREGSRNLRVSLQYVGMAHQDMTEMLGEEGGDSLHSKAMALAQQGKAEILETCVLVCQSRSKAIAESVREEIHPLEYGPMTAAWSIRTEPLNPMLRLITAFETRNTGVTFEMLPDISRDQRTIDLRLAPEVVTPVRVDTWMEHKDQWGDASLRMPVYETWRSTTALILQSGKFELISVITPKLGAPAPAVSRKILVFVRADIIPVPVESP